MRSGHRAWGLATVILALQSTLCLAADGPGQAVASIDRQLEVIQSVKDPGERRLLTSQLVDLCAFPPGDETLRLSDLQRDRLMRLLDDPEPWIRASAAACLGFNGPAALSVLPALRQAYRRTPIVEAPGFPGQPEATQPRDLMATAIRRIEGAIPVRNAPGASSPRD